MILSKFLGVLMVFSFSRCQKMDNQSIIGKWCPYMPKGYYEIDDKGWMMYIKDVSYSNFHYSLSNCVAPIEFTANSEIHFQTFEGSCMGEDYTYLYTGKWKKIDKNTIQIQYTSKYKSIGYGKNKNEFKSIEFNDSDSIKLNLFYRFDDSQTMKIRFVDGI